MIDFFVKLTILIVCCLIAREWGERYGRKDALKWYDYGKIEKVPINISAREKLVEKLGFEYFDRTASYEKRLNNYQATITIETLRYMPNNDFTLMLSDMMTRFYRHD